MWLLLEINVLLLLLGFVCCIWLEALLLLGAEFCCLVLIDCLLVMLVCGCYICVGYFNSVACCELLIVWLFLCLDFLVGCFCCLLGDDRFVVMLLF